MVQKRLDKAQIKYKTGRGNSTNVQTLRFHSVIAEEHAITGEVTKYPAQTGFNISNHVVKKNRIVTITGLISNTLIIGSKEFHEYGSNNVKVVYEGLRQLVHQGVPCEVQTNYTKYSPVIFTGFTTKLTSKTTDSMEFTLVGEEVQLALTVNQTAPALLKFTPYTEAQRAARVEELLNVGINVPDCAHLSEADFDLNQSHQIESIDPAGGRSISTYEKIITDPISNIFHYKLHTSNTKSIPAPTQTHFNWYGLMQQEAALQQGISGFLPDLDLTAGANTFSSCLKEEICDKLENEVDDLIETGLGLLKKSIYGAAYGIFGVNGDRSFGQMLLGLGAECLVVGAIGSANADNNHHSNIPSVSEALEGAEAHGRDLLGTGGKEYLTKVIRIAPPFLSNLL